VASRFQYWADEDYFASGKASEGAALGRGYVFPFDLITLLRYTIIINNEHCVTLSRMI
jgi:hypothetical protein